MICSNCAAENRASGKFCQRCGSPLARACPTCGTPVPAEAFFCDECGTRLDPGAAREPTPAATAVSGTERRLVTVLFADLVGFTSASESRDVEETRDLLSRYFAACQRLVELYGGTVEKFIGDAVMAVWGTPVANEDDAERAVRTALELLDAVRALGEETRTRDLQARAAVLTGEAAVTLGAVGQGMVAGDLVNSASRVQGLAPAGEVLVGERTRRLTDLSVVYEDFGSHEVKGREEPLRLWRALRVVAARGGAQRSSGLEPPFVGRDREVRLLKELFHATVDESRAHLVSVTGIAGIGKSRLAWEFFKYIDGLAGTIRWHHGRCLAYGEGVTYWALAEMVRTRAGIQEAEAAESALTKLQQALEESVPDPEERRWLEPRLAQLLGLAGPAQADRQDLFAAWRRFYERLSEEMPTVMVFEDMQWADPSLVEFVDYLLDWSRDHRLFVVTLGRAGEAQGGTARGHTALHLEPLSRAAMGELITALAPGLPEDLVASVLERAEGVPLYAVETVRMLLDRGLLVQEGTSYKPAGAIASLDVPESLHTLIAARLDGLDPDERQLIQQAAVLGKTFTAAGLTEVSGRPHPEVERLLTGLLRKEVLTVRSDPRSPERGQYGFLQDLVRQVAYETLSKRDRRHLHLKVAAHLESTFGPEQDEAVEVLASHYLEAYREAPEAEDSASIKDKARSMLARAGDRAASLAAAEEAQKYFERAADLADVPLERASLLDRAGVMAWRRARTDDAVAHFEAALELFEAEGDQRGAARVSADLADVQVAQGHLKSAAERLLKAYEVMSREPDEATAVVASQVSRTYMLMDRLDEAGPYYEKALGLAEALLLPEVFSHSLNTKGVILSMVGRPQEAILLLRRALEVALANSHWTTAFRAYTNLGVALLQVDRNREGDELFAEAVEHARRIGDRGETARALVLRSTFLVALGHWDDALAAVRDAEEVSGAGLLHNVWFIPPLQPHLHVLLQRGALEAARSQVEWASLGVDADQSDVRVASACSTAMLLLAEGKAAEALPMAIQAIESGGANTATKPALKESYGVALEAALVIPELATAEALLLRLDSLRPGETSPVLTGQCLRYRARLAVARGDPAGAEEAWKRAAAVFQEAELPFHQAAAQLELAEWLAAQSPSSQVAELLDDARAIFERLKAAPWLERLTRLEASPTPV